MSTMASSVSVFGPASARLIDATRKKIGRRREPKQSSGDNLHQISQRKAMLEKSEGGFVDDVYKKYIQSKLETNETVVNEGSDGGGKREAGEKGSGGADLKNAEVDESGKGEAGETTLMT
ncbi:hypothetical protein DY000_02001431 [Brassica cretica]|uniref:Uncharacterized protein n=1 Tax=Brassica cretica TaxID=69181 RepID=A0ABQ7C0X3_BRACR|nr:hypothetical protein DY000_02001431 [Brassica cretica]